MHFLFGMFRQDEGIFEEDFIEDRRKGLEIFVNKLVYIFKYDPIAFMKRRVN